MLKNGMAPAKDDKEKWGKVTKEGWKGCIEVKQSRDNIKRTEIKKTSSVTTLGWSFQRGIGVWTGKRGMQIRGLHSARRMGGWRGPLQIHAVWHY